jgi:hypothetical protein
MVAAALVVVGCGDVAPSPSTSVLPAVAVSLPPGGPCALVADAAGAIGQQPITSPTAYEVGATQRCTWVVARDPSRYVGLSVGPASNHGATMDAFGDGEAVDNLADDARWWAAARTLSVVVGDRSFQVDLQLAEPDATRDRAVDVARQVLDAVGAASGG